MTLNVQSPSVEASSSAASGSNGFHVPVNGRPRGGRDRERRRRRVVEDDLAEVVAAAARALEHPRSAPAGDGQRRRSGRRRRCGRCRRSVEPAVVVQVAPSTENRSFDAYPMPVTGIVTVAPRVLLSGIGTAGPV